MPPKENEVGLSELFALEEQVADLKDALYDARKQLKNAIAITEGATNGDMIRAMFPTASITDHFILNTPIGNIIYIRLEGHQEMRVQEDWWNAPYKESEG